MNITVTPHICNAHILLEGITQGSTLTAIVFSSECLTECLTEFLSECFAEAECWQNVV